MKKAIVVFLLGLAVASRAQTAPNAGSSGGSAAAATTAAVPAAAAPAAPAAAAFPGTFPLFPVGSKLSVALDATIDPQAVVFR